MSYKQPSVRVVFEFGRHSVQVLIGGVWTVVAIRERQDCAEALSHDLRDAMARHQDDDYAARARSSVDTVSPDGHDLGLTETPRTP